MRKLKMQKIRFQMWVISKAPIPHDGILKTPQELLKERIVNDL